MNFKKFPMSTKICLNMIVKDESHLGTRVLQNLKDNYDAAVIVDTGSTDNTVQIYTDYFTEQKIPFFIKQSDWKEFDGSRTEAIETAEEWLKDKKGTWYLLFFDADDLLSSTNPKVPFRITRSELTNDIYVIDIVHPNITYDRNLMIKVNPNKRWKFYCPVHEFVSTREKNVPIKKGKIKGCYINSLREGARNKDPEKYYKDALVFKKRLESMKVGDEFYDHHMYYMAQSYRDANMDELAEQTYLKRGYEVRMNSEYDYMALIEAVRIRINRLKYMSEKDYLDALKDIAVEDKIKLGHRGLIFDNTTLKILLDANQLRNFRYEAAVKICENWRIQGKYNLAYALAVHTLNLPKHNDIIFVDNADHSYKLLDVAAVCAGWIGKYIESKKYFEQLLTVKDLPEDVKIRTEKNLDFTIKRLNPVKIIEETKSKVEVDDLKSKIKNKREKRKGKK